MSQHSIYGKNEKPRRCKNEKCQKEFKPSNSTQAYCSRDCAPYGHWRDEVQDPLTLKRRKTKK